MRLPQFKELYERIGGEPQLKAILRDFYKRMSQDVLIGFFFTKKDTNAIADRQAQFLMYAMGVLDTYEGKTPTHAHLELPPILSGHFDRRLVILEQTLRDFHLSTEDIRTWIDFEKAFRNVVVDQKASG